MNTKIVVIAGTNASGKSSLGVSLARAFNGEVISADSRQVYKGLDLGTGKLDRNEMQGVPHHLIDVAEVSQVFTLADYQRLAYDAINAISARGRVPFIVGGTGLYIKSIIDGYSLATAPPNFELRKRLENLSDRDLWNHLSSINDEVARTFDPRNRQRVVRAIEIVAQGADINRATLNNPLYNALQLGLTWDAETMRKRISRRLQSRLQSGMVDEVRKLIDSGISSKRLHDLGLEYRYINQYIEGQFVDKAAFVDALTTAIYQFSRRQVRWFRREKGMCWLDTTGNYESEAHDRISKFFAH